MLRTAITAIQGHTFAAVGYAVGILCALAVIVTLHDTRQTVERNTTRIDRIEASTPCKNLSTSECAAVLFAALPDKQRHKFIRQTIESDKYIHELKERQNNPPPPPGRAIPDEPQQLPNPIEPIPPESTPPAPTPPESRPDPPNIPTTPTPPTKPDTPKIPDLPELPQVPTLPELPNLDLHLNP